MEELNPEQVKNVLKFIDANESEAVKDRVFRQLGRECFYTRKLDQWMERYHGNVQAFLDRINIEQTSKYWERLEYTPDRTAIILTGRKVENCACAFASCPQPPLSLCRSCCRGFQEEYFRNLLGRNVEVEITEAYLFGGERCSTIIHILEE